MPKQKFSAHSLFWLITISVMIGLTVPVLIQDGMFMDAILYASVSHNLAQGIGTFWNPQFAYYTLDNFHEHPPLVFGIQSLFFKAFGDSMYIERLYTFLTLCISALLVNSLWKLIYRDNENLRNMGWLPVLLWITIPNAFWSYANDMQENTMGIFTLLAVLFTYRGLRYKAPALHIAISGLFIFLASFSKGIPGLFPLAVPVVYWLTSPKLRLRKVLLYTLLLIAVPAVIYAILMCFETSRDSLTYYLFHRVFSRIKENPTVTYRLYTLQSIFEELLGQLLFLIIILFIAWKKKISYAQPGQKSTFAFFFLIGLCAALPLMLTLVQKAFYYVPALPFFAIGIAALTAPVLLHFIQLIKADGLRFRMALFGSIVLLAVIVVYSGSQAGKVHRDKELLNDIYLVKTIVPHGGIIKVPEDQWNNWALQCYMMRYCNISLTLDHPTPYCLQEKEMQPPPGFEKINLPTLQFDLFQRAQ